MNKNKYPLLPLEFKPVNPHQAFEKLRGDTDTIVIFIHGFLGSPRQFAEFGDFVYKQGYAYASLLLPGHGGTAKDFAVNSQQQWIAYLHRQVHHYAGLYANVFLVGHSMGGLLAINESLCPKANVKGLILLNTAIKIGLKSRYSMYTAKNWFSRYPVYNRIDRYYRENNSVEKGNLFRTISWLPRVIDLVRLSKMAVKNLPLVKVPVLITQSRNDEAVLHHSAAIIEKGLISCPYHRLVYFKRSWHSYYFKKEKAQLKDEMKCFLNICTQRKTVVRG